MKKRKTAAFLAALMICAWVPQVHSEPQPSQSAVS